MGFKVTAPLVIVPHIDPAVGGDGYFYKDAVIPDGFNDERCKVLADEGMLEKLSPAEEKSVKADAKTAEKAAAADKA